MGTCFTVEKDNRPGSRREKEFESMQSMQRLGTLHQVQDIKINKSDFVLQHKNTKFHQRYKVDTDKILGSGGFGTVQSCEHNTTHERRAVKIMNKNKISQQEQVRLRYEIDILKNLDHPNILRLYEVFEDKKQIYLVTEYCKGGELFDEILSRGKFEEKDAAFILKQLLSAVSYCHSKNVCHRDLKPENILIDNKDKSTIKLIDFGTSQVFEGSEKMELILGTAYYIAPEVLSGQYDEKCDIWSIGVILFILLSGEPPFPGDTDQEIIDKVRKGKYSFSRPVWKSRSNQVKQFIAQMMNINPEERPTAAEALEHVWITQKAVEQVDESAAKEALSNLKRFRVEQKLYQAALTFIVCQLSTRQERDLLYQSFKAFDKNGDGKITKDELFIGYKKIYKHLNDAELQKEVDRMFEQADQDGNGEIDYSEWQVATINKYDVLQEEKLKDAFKLFDKDGNGNISAHELKNILGVGKKFGKDSNNIWDDIIKEVDINGDGVISYQEFQIMMTKFLRQSEMVDSQNRQQIY